MGHEESGPAPVNPKVLKWWREWLRSEEALRLRRNGFAIPLEYRFYVRFKDWYPHITETFGVWAVNKVMLDE